jgi:hypothetical protein
MKLRMFSLALAAALFIVACDDSTDPGPVDNTVTFKATLSGASEVPANASTATGNFTATLDTVTNAFVYDVTFTGLSGNVNNGHIHGPSAAGLNSGTTINFNTLPGATFSFGLPAGTAHGATVLNAATQITATMSGDSLKKLLFAGLTYANIHTTALPGGEIRGQITRQ